MGFALFFFVSCARVSATSQRALCRLNAGMALLARPGIVEALFPFPGCATREKRGRIKHGKSKERREVAYIDVDTRVTRITVTMFALLIVRWLKREKEKKKRKEKEESRKREGYELRSTDWNSRGSV